MLAQQDKPVWREWWSAGAGVELMKIVLGGPVGVDLLIQVLLTAADRDTNTRWVAISKKYPVHSEFYVKYFVTYAQNVSAGNSLKIWCLYVQYTWCSLCLLRSGQLHVVTVYLNPLLSPQLICSLRLLLCCSRQPQELEVPSCILGLLSVALSLRMARNGSIHSEPWCKLC